MSMLKCSECGARGVRPIWSVLAQAEVAAWCPTCDRQLSTPWTENPLGDLRRVTERLAESHRYRAADAARVAEEMAEKARRRASRDDYALFTLTVVVLLIVLLMAFWETSPSTDYCC